MTKKTRTQTTIRSFPQFTTMMKREAAEIIKLMKKTWGYTPAMTWKTEPCLIVSVDFNIKNFAHRGRKIYVRKSTMNGYRKPGKVARDILSEIVVHRNTCKECGVGTPPIWERLSRVEYGMRNGMYYNDDGAPVTRLPARFLVPPDPVEERVEPVRARRLRRHLTLIANKEASR